MNTQSAYPLQWPDGWPRTPAQKREWGNFDGTPDLIRRCLVAEIDRIVLGARAKTHTVRKAIVISTNVPLRRDGEPIAGRNEPDDPGVAVYFTRNGKSVCLACDKYNKVWKNMRAIQRTIEALRGIERWGSSQLLDRAFTGFIALAEKTQATCWEVLQLELGATYTADDIRAAYHKRAMETHPDRGGSTEAFTEVQTAFQTAMALFGK